MNAGRDNVALAQTARTGVNETGGMARSGEKSTAWLRAPPRRCGSRQTTTGTTGSEG